MNVAREIEESSGSKDRKHERDQRKKPKSILE